jgi:hypothetical protein
MANIKSTWNAINGGKGAQVLTAGGSLGTANIAFTANPVAGTTIRVNNTIFTISADASTTTNINLKGTLALTLAEAETVIQSNPTVGVGSGVIVNVDVTNTNADLTFRFHPNAFVYAFASSTDGGNTTDTGYVAGTGAPRIDLNKSEVLLEWASASAALTYLDLPKGRFDGQLLSIYAVSVANSGDSVGIIGDFASSNNLLTIGGSTTFLATEGCTLYWSNSGGVWKVKVANDAVASTMQSVAL